MTSHSRKIPGDQKKQIIEKIESLIREFNPVTHSIDTHILEHLGVISECKDYEKQSDLQFMQQVLYGWYKEKRILESFINDFYADNAASISRADIITYTIFAYLAIFRLDELKFSKFKEFAMTADPSRVSTFVSYLFNKDILWSTLREGWMKVVDLTFVEEKLIKSIEKFIPDAQRLCDDLQVSAMGLAAAQAAKEQAKKDGTAGVGKVVKKESCRPQSPKLSRNRIPKLPEPQEISQKVSAKEVPKYLDKTSLKLIDEENKKRREETRLQVQQKYGSQYEFEFSENKCGRPLEDVRKEIEEENIKELDFDRSYYKKPPDFQKNEAKVRLNVATILREDSLLRKQQAKDVQLLKNYEMELRDPTEYYLWQQEMKERDEKINLQQVALRREQSKQSSEEARLAISQQLEGNKAVAAMLREQAEAIKLQKALEAEIQTLQNEGIVESVRQTRHLPQIAVEKVVQQRVEIGKKTREEQEKVRVAKEEADRVEKLRQADIIRQQRALNTVHKKHVKVFDPTETSSSTTGAGFLDEMSYMEMKERLAAQHGREETQLLIKKQEIIELKEKKAQLLENRVQAIILSRQAKAAANRASHAKKVEAVALAEADKEKAREVAAQELEAQLRKNRAEKKAQAAALVAEEERVRRQQQYLGAAKGVVDEARAEQLLKARERKIKETQAVGVKDAIKIEEAKHWDHLNRLRIEKEQKVAKKVEMAHKEKDYLFERREAVERLKREVISKKQMAAVGREQHNVTKKVTEDFNPYAARMNQEIHETVLLKTRGIKK